MLCWLTTDRVFIHHQQHVNGASRCVMLSLTVVPSCFLLLSSCCRGFLCSTFKLNSVLFSLLLPIDPKWDQDFTYGKKRPTFEVFCGLCPFVCVVTFSFPLTDYTSLRTAGLSIAAVLFIVGIMVIGCKYDPNTVIVFDCPSHSQSGPGVRSLLIPQEILALQVLTIKERERGNTIKVSTKLRLHIKVVKS